jgi:hypothetical protein
VVANRAFASRSGSPFFEWWAGNFGRPGFQRFAENPTLPDQGRSNIRGSESIFFIAHPEG